MINLLELDLKPLEEALTSKLGIDIKLERKVYTIRCGKERLSFNSQDIKEHTGILKNIYKYLHVTDFGSEVISKEDETYLWMGLNITFSYVHGGSNGTNIGNCWYYPDKDEWKFQINV